MLSTVPWAEKSAAGVYKIIPIRRQLLSDQTLVTKLGTCNAYLANPAISEARLQRIIAVINWYGSIAPFYHDNGWLFENRQLDVKSKNFGRSYAASSVRMSWIEAFRCLGYLSYVPLYIRDKMPEDVKQDHMIGAVFKGTSLNYHEPSRRMLCLSILGWL